MMNCFILETRERYEDIETVTSISLQKQNKYIHLQTEILSWPHLPVFVTNLKKTVRRIQNYSSSVRLYRQLN